MTDVAEPLLLNPFDPEFHADPYRVYRAFRERDPMHKIPFWGMYMVTRHVDVIGILRDHRFGHSPDPDAREQMRREQTVEERAMGSIFLSLDPPDHTRLRGLVSKAFTPRSVEDLRPKVQALVATILDEAATRGEMDVMADLAFPVPFTVICELLGVPTEGRQEMRRMSQAIIANSGLGNDQETQDASDAAAVEFVHFMRDLINEKRKAPTDDLISRLITVEEQGDTLTEEELWATCFLVLVAGFETTVNLIGNGTWALLGHPDQRPHMVSNPKVAVEELLRWDSPVQFTSRVALEDLEVAGSHMMKGDTVMVGLAAANRDPEVFPDPERLDLTRQPSPHMSLGNGIHFCLGAPLARLEGQEALSALFSRFPDIAFAGDAPQWNGNMIFRGLKALPVKLRQ